MPSLTRWHLRFPAASENDLNQVRRYLAAFRADSHVQDVLGHVPPEDPFSRDLRVIFRLGFNQPLTPELQHMNLRHLIRSSERSEETFTDAARRLVSTFHAAEGEMLRPTTGIFDFEYPPAPAWKPDPVPLADVAPWIAVGAWAQELDKSTRPFRIMAFTQVGDEPSLSVWYHGDQPATWWTLRVMDVLLKCGPVPTPMDERPTAWTRVLQGLGEDEK